MRASWKGTTHLIAAEMLGKQKLPPAKFSTLEVFRKGSTFIQQEVTVTARLSVRPAGQRRAEPTCSMQEGEVNQRQRKCITLLRLSIVR